MSSDDSDADIYNTGKLTKVDDTPLVVVENTMPHEAVQEAPVVVPIYEFKFSDLDWSVTDSDIKNKLQDHGNVIDITFVQNERSGQSTGVCKIKMGVVSSNKDFLEHVKSMSFDDKKAKFELIESPFKKEKEVLSKLPRLYSDEKEPIPKELLPMAASKPEASKEKPAPAQSQKPKPTEKPSSSSKQKSPEPKKSDRYSKSSRSDRERRRYRGDYYDYYSDDEYYRHRSYYKSSRR